MSFRLARISMSTVSGRCVLRRRSRASRAVGYFFGRNLQKELNVPIGLINTNWGGTRIEPWTPGEAFAEVPALKDIYRTGAAPPPLSRPRDSSR